MIVFSAESTLIGISFRIGLVGVGGDDVCVCVWGGGVVV